MHQIQHKYDRPLSLQALWLAVIVVGLASFFLCGWIGVLSSRLTALREATADQEQRMAAAAHQSAALETVQSDLSARLQALEVAPTAPTVPPVTAQDLRSVNDRIDDLCRETQGQWKAFLTAAAVVDDKISTTASQGRLTDDRLDAHIERSDAALADVQARLAHLPAPIIYLPRRFPR